MLRGFSASMSLGVIFEWRAAAAHLWGCALVYRIPLAVAFIRLYPLTEAVTEVLTAIIGNAGFPGMPMLLAPLGPPAAGAVQPELSIDLIVPPLLTILFLLRRYLRNKNPRGSSFLRHLLGHRHPGQGPAWRRPVPRHLPPRAAAA